MSNTDQSKLGILNGSDISRFKTFSSWGVFGLLLITFGIYIFYWLYTRALVLNSINVKKISEYLLNGFIISIILSYSHDLLEFAPELLEQNKWMSVVFSINSIVFLILYLMVLFKVHDSLQNLMFSSSRTEKISLNILFTFLFGIIYLQYKINEYNEKRKSIESENHGSISSFILIFSFAFVFLAFIMGSFMVTALSDMRLKSAELEPDFFNVKLEAFERIYATRKTDILPPGYIYANTLGQMAKTLLYKPGGYLSNDVTMLSDWFMNLKAWEFGVLIMLREGTTALRDQFTTQSNSSSDPDLAHAEPYFYFQRKSWVLPSTETEYEKGIAALHRYMVRLENNNISDPSHFHINADALSQYLQVVVKRLEAYHTVLTSNLDKIEHKNETQTEQVKRYYEARGASWALIHMLIAIKYEFPEASVNSSFTQLIDNTIKEIIKGLAQTNDKGMCIQCMAKHMQQAIIHLTQLISQLET